MHTMLSQRVPNNADAHTDALLPEPLAQLVLTLPAGTRFCPGTAVTAVRVEEARTSRQILPEIRPFMHPPSRTVINLTAVLTLYCH